MNTFDVNRQTCLQTGWSKSGIVYLLLQKYCKCPNENAPVCHTNGWKLVFAGSCLQPLQRVNIHLLK